MISVVNISLGFGGRALLKDVGFRLGPHDRIGLIGSNGAGKTTLLKILVGSQLPEVGEVAKAKYVTVGYLPQEGMSTAGRTLYDEAESVFADILETRKALDDVHRQMREADHATADFSELLEVYGELQHKLEASDAFRMKTGIEKVLTGLGFAKTDFQRMTEEFSGGWQMRIALARLLLQQPSLLLLDEPTNHLDLDSLQWLEEYLRSYEGAVMLVSHDSRFLDTMTTKTFELSMGALTIYMGNYSRALQEKGERREHQLAAHRNQQQQIKQTERFIERFRYKATKARQVQSRIKQLEKLERIEIEDEESAIHFSFPAASPSGRSVMELRGIRKSYGTLSVFSGIDFDVDRADRIAFVGVNGAGKSTLARILAGIEPVDDGTRIIGHNVVLSYFAQHQAEELKPDLDVLETVNRVAVGDIRKNLRNLLGCFLFSGDDVFKKVSVLSGGEKSRLALAKMLLEPSNFIILDEPTNHLDMRSKAVLQTALLEFEGSCVIVSHDRDFLDPLVTKVVEFREGRIKTYLGNVSEYIEAKRKESQAVPAPPPGPAAERETERDRKRREAEERQQQYRRSKPVKDKIAALEARLESHEKEKTGIEQSMSAPDFYREGDKVKERAARYKELEGLLTDGYHQWNELMKELERIQDHGKEGDIHR
jgi:ATP-binding cassette subfamily F protein 3